MNQSLAKIALASTLALSSLSAGCEGIATVATIMSTNHQFNQSRGDLKVYRSGKIVPLKVGDNYWINIWAKDIESISVTSRGEETIYGKNSPNLTEDRDIYWFRLEQEIPFNINVTTKTGNLEESFNQFDIKNAYLGNYTNSDFHIK